MEHASNTVSTQNASVGDAPIGLRRGWLAAFIFALVLVQGLTVNLIPVVMDIVGRTFQITSKEQIGHLQSTFLAGGMLSLFLSGYVTDYVRAARSGTLAVVMVATGFVILGAAGSFRQSIAAAGMIGMGNGWILAVYSAVITEHFPDIRRRLFMWATAIFALSTSVGNYAIGLLLVQTSDWQMIFSILGVGILFCWGTLIVYGGTGLAAIGWKNAEAPNNQTSITAVAISPWRAALTYLYSGLLNRWTLWLLGFLMALEDVGAICGVTWTAQLLRQEHGINDAQAAAVLSLGSLGVFLGRLLLGALVSSRFTDLTVLGVCYSAAVVTYSALLMVSNYGLSLALFFLWGALVSAQAPTMYSMASAKFGARAATAIPLANAIGSVGSFLGPSLLGKLADHTDLHLALWFVPAIGALFVALVFVWAHYDRIA